MKPSAKKLSVNVSLRPETYAKARKLCYDEGVSLSAKIGLLFEAWANATEHASQTLEKSGKKKMAQGKKKIAQALKK